MNIQKQAFTLVELIVVITILAILATISFISLSGYASSSRDSARVADLKTISRVLDLHKTTENIYPNPTNGVQVTYSGSEVWTQGVFGDDTRRDLGGKTSISDSPKDPLTSTFYTYSLLNTKQEYQLGAILEDSSFTYSPVGSAFAGDRIGNAYIKGDYNGAIAKAYSGSIDTTFILAVPSIINSDMNLVDLVNIVDNNKLVYKGYSNLPSSYSGSVYNIEGSPSLNVANSNELVIFSGSLEQLTDGNTQVAIANSLQEAYSGTTIAGEENIERIINLNPGINPEASQFLVQTMIKNSIDSSVEVTAEDVLTIQEQYLGANSNYTSTWSSTCDVNNISIVNVSPGTDLSTISTANNTIYRFEEGTYTTTGNFIFGGTCIGILGVGNVEFDFANSYYVGLGSSDKVAFSNITVKDTTSGMLITSSSNISVTDSVFNGSAGYGLSFNNVDNSLMSSITSHGHTNDGIEVYQSDNNTLTNVVTYSNSDDGISIQDSNNIIVTTVDTYSNSDDGVELATVNNINLTGITAYSNIDNGLVSKVTSSNIDISNSVSYNNGENGGIFRDTHTLNINNFDTYGNGIDGIVVKDGSYNVVVDNSESYNNTGDGLFIDDDGDAGEALSYNITIRNSSFYTNTGTLSNGINSWNSANLVLENVTTYGNTVDGMYISDGSNTLTNLTSYSNSNHGVYLTGSSVSNLTGIISYSNSFDGVKLGSNSSAITVNNVTAYSNGRDGLSLRNVPNADVNLVLTYSNTYDGLYGHTIGDSTFDNITTHGNGEEGIHFSTSTNVTTNNVIAYSNTSDGFYSHDLGTSTYTDITTYQNGDDGFQISNTTGAASASNILSYSNTSDGVILYNSTGGIAVREVISYSNGSDGVYLYNSDSASFSDFKSYFNGGDGVEIRDGNGITVNNGIAYNNGNGDDAAFYVREADNISVSNIVGFNNEYSIYTENNTTTSVFNNFVSYKNDNDQVNVYDDVYLINSKFYSGADEGVDINTGGAVTYYGDLTVFGNATGDTGTKTQGTSGFLGFANGNLITSGTFDATMVVDPNITSWDYNTSGLQTGLTLPSTLTYAIGSGILTQSQPIRWNGISFELYGTDGVDYDSTKYIGEF